jgi:oxepin-CoA hydrolase/3-oxo-5,6-dehydrosuberyl-CoA semialdehyde dehydrogenase
MGTSNATRRVESYVSGQWQKGQGSGRMCLDAVTGAEIGLVDAGGIDMGAVLDHARNIGGPNLRAMSPHARALMMKAIGSALMEQKEALYALSAQTGATRSDSWIDIDGGIGTMLTYASRVRRELPNSNVMADGKPEVLARDGSFLGQHIWSPLTGAAVHINAFNFPVWGMLEKLAPTWAAGLPAIIKPASQTAYVTEACVRMILDTGLVPEGALQLICGSVGDLLDRVECQDVVTFTGSAAVARQLRSHPVIVEKSVRFSAEADSLNATILGPDITEDAPEFELFQREILREMTAKAGQKCTAIRRVILPRAMVPPLRAALSDKIAAIRVGDPRSADIDMGALASADQVDEVLTAVDQICQEAKVIAKGQAPETGAFVAPHLLYCDDPLGATAPHQVEAFGPVCTLMPYDTISGAIEIANRGGGSLVASVFTNDAEVTREIGQGIAAMHGRVMFGNRNSAKTATGHGSPMPVLVHGGPGRAGGGEELGGVRAVYHYMQRSAVQGTPDQITAVTGIWAKGAATRDDIHPFQKPLSDLRVGDMVQTASRVVTLEDIEHFAHFTGDTFYAHMDEDAARRNPFFPGRVAHGYLIVSFAAGLFVDPGEGPVLANYGWDNLRFMAPVSPGDALSVQLVTKDITPREGEGHGEVRWDCTVLRDGEAVVAQYDVLTLVAKEPRVL